MHRASLAMRGRRAELPSHPGKGSGIPWLQASADTGREASGGSCRKSAPGLLALGLENQDFSPGWQEGQEVVLELLGLPQDECSALLSWRPS